MNSSHWFRVSGCVLSAFLAVFSLDMRLFAQSSSAVSERGPFVAAPTLPLAYAPASVAMGDLNGDGKPDLVTADWNSGKVTVALGLGNGSFAAGVDYPAGAHPTSLRLADMDGDGRLDLVLANAPAGTVSILFGNGDGLLRQPRIFSVGIHPSLLAIGNFNASGRVDLVAVDPVSNQTALLLNDGQGGFGAPSLHALSRTPAGVTVADLNHDGYPDLAFANTDGSISIVWGGKGSFHDGPSISAAPSALSAILAGDFHHTGNLDLVVAVPGQKQLLLLAGNGDGSFAGPLPYRVGGNPVAILAADLDGDGVADLIVTNQGSNSFSVLGGNSDGTFRAALDFVAGNGPIAAVAGDFNGDGHTDLAVLNRDGQSLSLPLGNGDGTFRAARSYSVEMQPRAIAAGDLTGGKRSDLAITNYCGSDTSCAKGGSVSVLLAGENGAYHLASTYALGSEPVDVALADIDGDKNLDIVALNRGDKTISVLLGQGAGTFQQPFTLPLSAAPVAFATGDFNHDGKTDLAVVEDCGTAKCAQPGTLEILYGSGDGSFRTGPSYTVDFAPSSVAIADLNSDKNVDIVVANRCGKTASCTSSTASVFLSNAAGLFSNAPSISLGKSSSTMAPAAIALADLSGRGTPDLLVTSSADNTLGVLRGNGDGTFGTPQLYTVGKAPGSIAVADFNGDGKLDIAVGNMTDASVSLLYGKGDGTLLAGPVTSVGPGPAAMAPLQNGSGKRAGLATANANSAAAEPGSEITVLANLSPEIIGSTLSATTIQANPTSANVDDMVTLTAVVTGDTADGAPAGGSVTFTSAPDTIADCNGTASNVVSTSTAATDTSIFVCVTHSLQATSQTVNAAYSGDSVYAISSSSTAATVTVAALPATLTLASSVSTTPVDATVTFTPTLTASASSPIAPSGTVSFKINGASSTDCPDQLITASPACTTKSLTVGHGTVTATYSGDNNFTFTGTATKTITVTALPASMTLGTSVSTTPVNGSVTFTPSVTASSVSPVAPSGTVHFLVNGAASSDCPDQLITAPAACTTKTLTVGNGTVTASYSGDSNFTVTGTATKTVTVTPLAATVTLGPLASTPTVNQSVTFNAAVTASSIAPTYPSGSVAFTINGKSAGCAGTLNTSGQASCVTTALIAPSDTVIATYAGDTNFTVTASTGTSTQTPAVSPISASLVLTMPTTAAVAKNVSITVALPGSVSLTTTKPAASVAFTVNGATPTSGTPLYECLNQSFASGTMSCTTSFASGGPYEIVASYPGYPSTDPNFNLGVALQAITIGQSTGLVIKLNAQSGSGIVNQPVKYTLALTPPTNGAAPTGSVTFNDLTTATALPCSPVQLVSPGTSAVCSQTFGAQSDDMIQAVYSGDGSYPTQTSNTVATQVNAEPTTTAISLATPNPSTVNQTVSFTATVTTASVSVTPLTGTVTFTDTSTNASMCNSVNITVAGATATATCSYAFPTSTAQPQQVQATFNPLKSTQFVQSSGTINQQVGAQDPTSTSVTLGTGSASPSSVNQSVTIVAKVLPTYPGGATMKGKVTFTDALSQASLCSGVNVTTTTDSNMNIISASASCTVPLTVAGADTITASFVDSLSNYKSSSGNLSQTVLADTTSIAFTSSLTVASTVDQTISFTAAIIASPTYVASGATVLQLPTGTVTFTDQTTNTILCNAVKVSAAANAQGLITASCTYSNLSGGVHSVTASYGGDLNFVKSAANAPPAAVTVSPSMVTISVAASSSPIATQAASIVATIQTAPVNNAAPPGSIAPDGTVTFQSANTNVPGPTTVCNNVPLQPISASMATATCQVIFNDASDTTAETPVGVTVTYNPGTTPVNFLAGAAPTPATIAVRNFQLANSAPAASVFVSQGSANTAGPFTTAPFSATPVTVTPTLINGFSDVIDLSCTVTPAATAPATTPACGFGASSPSATGSFSAGSMTPVTLTITSGTKDGPGQYIVTVTGTDHTTQALMQSTTFTLTVVQVIGTLSVASGATTEADVSFAVPQTVTLSNFACANIINTTTNTPANGNGLSCAAGTPAPWSAGAIQVPITITAGAPASSAGTARSAAALWAMPLVAVLLWLLGGRTQRRSLLRFLSLLLLAVGLSAGIGCGGSFTGPPPVTGTASGNYAIEVTASGSDGNTYSAIVTIYVAAN